jgi:hypothetical protein
VGVAAAEAGRRLEDELTSGSASPYSSGASAAGGGLLRWAPLPALGQLVHFTRAGPHWRDGTLALPLRWSATPPAWALSPEPDGSEERDDHPAGSRAILAAGHREALGDLSEAMARLGGHPAAAATAHSVLRGLAEALTNPPARRVAAQAPNRASR